MKEQVQRLNKTPGVETQAGVLQTGVTQTANMGYVQQKESKGSKLAKTLGMVTDTAMKGYELYQGQKDEEALSQFHTDKIQIIEELNGLNSDADRVLYMNDKIKKASSPDVNVKYRDALINSFGGKYDSYLKGAKVEGYKAQENEFFKRIATGLNDPDFTYEGLVSEFGPRVRKENLHNIYASALLQNAQLDSADIKTKEDLDMFKAKYKEQFKTYNANPYAGGSKSKEAVDIQSKLKQSFDTIVGGKTKVFKEDFNLMYAQSSDLPMMTEDMMNKRLQEAYANGYVDKAGVYTKSKEYGIKLKEFLTTSTQINNFDVASDNNTNWEAGIFTSKAKEANTSVVKSTLQQSLANNNLSNVVDVTRNNSKIALPIVKSMLKTTGNAKADSDSIALYNSLKSTKDGSFIITNLDAKDRALLDIASTMQGIGVNIDYTEVYKNVNSNETPIMSVANKKTFRKSFAGIPQDLQDSMNTYGMALMKGGMSLSDTTEKIKEIVDMNVKDLGNWNPLVTNVKAINFDATPFKTDKEDVIVDVFKDYSESFGIDMSGTNIKYDGTNDEYYVYEEGNSLMPIKIFAGKEVSDFRANWIKADTDEKIAEADTEREEALQKKQALKNSLSNPYYDGGSLFSEGGSLYKPEKQQQAADQWEEFKGMVDEGLNSVVDFFSPTAAEGSELQLTTEGESRIKSLFNNVETVDDTTNTGISNENFLAENYNAASTAEQQGWLSNSNRPVETPVMQKNLATIENIVGNTRSEERR